MAGGTATGGPTRPTSEEVGYVELSRGGRELGGAAAVAEARSLMLARGDAKTWTRAARSSAAADHHDLNPDDRRF